MEALNKDAVFPEIESERLILRKITSADAGTLLIKEWMKVR